MAVTAQIFLKELIYDLMNTIDRNILQIIFSEPDEERKVNLRGHAIGALFHGNLHPMVVKINLK